jgi:Uma2 family endonuclease
LVEGIVYMPSPVRHGNHSHPHSLLVTWVGTYSIHTPGVESGDNGSVRLDLDNEPQPDAYLIVRADCGGQSRISEDDCVEGPPELVAEVTSSTASYDLGDKLKAYRRNGVREYIVWRVLEQQLDWFALRDDQFVPLEVGEDGVLRSSVFPGLWLDRAALLAGELTTVFDVLRRGLESEEHREFAKRLKPASGA